MSVSRNYRKNKLKNSILNIVITFLAVIILSYFLKMVLPNFKVEKYREFLGLNSESIVVNLDNKLVSFTNFPMYEEDEIFLPVDFIKKYIDDYIFWDSSENKLIITTENNVIRMETDRLKYFVNDKPLELNIPVYNIESVAYIPSSFLTDFYNLGINFIKNTNILNVYNLDKEQISAKITAKKVKVRFEADKKSPIIEVLNLGDLVTLIGEPVNNYQKIQTENGYIGFVLEKSLGDKVKNKPILPKQEEKKQVWSVEKGKINLVFEQMQNVMASNSKSSKNYYDGIDVLVPTWFSFLNENGDIRNISDKGYVSRAHSQNYQVWGLLTDNFDSKISHAVLSSTKNREHVIKQLLAFVSLYNLDGINIDFESVPKDDGEYFIQFLRELAPLLKEQGAVLSVDLFVPKPWTSHYNRKEVAKIADYLIVMGYDEHYSGSKKAGSVASISWSEEAILNTLKENVPKEKLILGIPFYTRIWTEEDKNGEIKLSSKAYGMKSAYDFIKDKGGEFIWLEDMGQYYGEVKEGNITYKAWLEDEKSVEKRLDLVLKYDIAGVGAWKRGLEKEEIWEILKDKLKDWGKYEKGF